MADALRAAARAAGRRLAEDAPSRCRRTRRATPVGELLARYGYEPAPAADGLVLANCPFHRLAEDYTELVCGMNLDLVDGVLDGLGPGGLGARLDPGPDRCCVTIRTRP